MAMAVGRPVNILKSGAVVIPGLALLSRDIFYSVDRSEVLTNGLCQERVVEFVLPNPIAMEDNKDYSISVSNSEDTYDPQGMAAEKLRRANRQRQSRYLSNQQFLFLKPRHHARHP